MDKMSGVKLIELPKILDDRGNLSFLESNNHIPFEIRRSYLIYDVPGGAKRGGHAYKKQQEFIICLSGSFDVHVISEVAEHTYSLNRSYYGLYIPPGNWRQIENFSTNSIGLISSSTFYDPEDYIRDYSVHKTQLNDGK